MKGCDIIIKYGGKIKVSVIKTWCGDSIYIKCIRHNIVYMSEREIWSSGLNSLNLYPWQSKVSLCLNGKHKLPIKNIAIYAVNEPGWLMEKIKHCIKTTIYVMAGYTTE